MYQSKSSFCREMAPVTGTVVVGRGGACFKGVVQQFVTALL